MFSLRSRRLIYKDLPVFGGSILAVFLNPTTTLEKQFDRGVFPGGARSPAALVVVSGWFPPVSWLSFLVVLVADALSLIGERRWLA